VTLSPHTTITLAKGFNKDNRDIRVDGEAFFDLMGVTGAPFGVLTRDLKIAVGASRFRVDASSSRPGEEVDLLEGRLKAAKSYPSTMDNEPEVLESGEMVMVNRDVDLMEKEKLSPDEMARLKKKF
jgi:ferric-dicitrate binding protein FerR (iron transport regulator)